MNQTNQTNSAKTPNKPNKIEAKVEAAVGVMDNEGPNPQLEPDLVARNDERLSEHVTKCLKGNAKVDPAKIQVRISNGEVTLTGSVVDLGMKEAAASCVAQLGGVKKVWNRLELGRAA